MASTPAHSAIAPVAGPPELANGKIGERRRTASSVDARALAGDLSARIEGEVRFDEGSRALYSTGSSNFRQVPIGVVVPKTIADVVATVEICRRHGAPLLSRGGGTSLAGQVSNVAVVMDMSKHLNGLIELDPIGRHARVEPGIVLDDLRAAAEKHHLTFGPDPSTHNHCTLGGMIGNNSCGVHSVMAGRTVDNVEALEVLTYDGLRMRVGRTPDQDLERIIGEGGRRGQIYRDLRSLRDRYASLIRQRYPKIPRRVSGYSLDELLPENGFNVARALVGSESTCVTVLEATVRLVYSPPARSLVALGYSDVYTAADHVPAILPCKPIALEGIDDLLVEDMKAKGLHPRELRLLPEGRAWLLVEFGGETKEEADGQAHQLMKALEKDSARPTMKLFDDPAQEHLVWLIRESGLGATALVPGKPLTWEGWEDSAVPPEALGRYLRDLRKLLQRHGYFGDFYGHFGQGCLHTRIDFELATAEGIRNYGSFMEEAADLVVSYGGSLSGEHGDGQSRGELLPKMFGEELIQAFREFKTIWDPDWKMNPGKKIDAYRLDENLRIGTSYDPPQPKTHFAYPDDHGTFARAALRCVGVGDCRKEGKGTMCPSYMVTREEMHSTRGRARLLFEMLQGHPLRGGWRDRHVREALDLCFACKGCKGECPVNVDMATYKAEFLSHYYAGRLRPPSAYAFGLIYWWARMASMAPSLVNAVTRAPLLGGLARALSGMAPQRTFPQFAPQTFKAWFRRRDRRNTERPPVILWADTFNNHFHPDTARAAVEVLEAAGFQVLVPEKSLCCGRPLYDYGFLTTARRLLEEILSALGPQIAEGVPLVGLEPSCLAVFRDELVNLLPNDEQAKRLSRQSFLLSEFLAKKAPDYQPATLRRKALVHGHCHHKALMGMRDEEAVLRKLGLDYQLVDSGCCGMAGAFGFEKEHYRISIEAGERVLLPAVRQAPDDTLIIADGFSCREQIAQTTKRSALHLAQVIQLAQNDEQRGGGPNGRQRE